MTPTRHTGAGAQPTVAKAPHPQAGGHRCSPGPSSCPSHPGYLWAVPRHAALPRAKTAPGPSPQTGQSRALLGRQTGPRRSPAAKQKAGSGLEAEPGRAGIKWGCPGRLWVRGTTAVEELPRGKRRAQREPARALGLPKRHRQPRVRQGGAKHTRSPHPKGKGDTSPRRGLAIPAAGRTGPPRSPPASCSLPSRASSGPGSRGAAQGPACDLLYRSPPCWDGAE